MITANLHQLTLTEFTTKDKPGQRCLATFPMIGTHGTADSATVYFELAPGDELGTHTDSAEELLLILEGEADITVREEQGRLGAGQLALVPKQASHNIRNAGEVTLKVLGFFGGANHITAVFEENWLPIGSNVVSTNPNP